MPGAPPSVCGGGPGSLQLRRLLGCRTNLLEGAPSFAQFAISVPSRGFKRGVRRVLTIKRWQSSSLDSLPLFSYSSFVRTKMHRISSCSKYASLPATQLRNAPSLDRLPFPAHKAAARSFHLLHPILKIHNRPLVRPSPVTPGRLGLIGTIRLGSRCLECANSRVISWRILGLAGISRYLLCLFGRKKPLLGYVRGAQKTAEFSPS